MIVSHLSVKNWRNFQRVDVRLRERQFIVGANASGKSNLLDTVHDKITLGIADRDGILVPLERARVNPGHGRGAQVCPQD
jgi:ABC-type uncharacterized transport system ATPase component